MKKAKQMTLVEDLLGCYRKRKKENFPYFRNKKGLKTLYQTYCAYMETPVGFEPTIRVLQTHTLLIGLF